MSALNHVIRFEQPTNSEYFRHDIELQTSVYIFYQLEIQIQILLKHMYIC